MISQLRELLADYGCPECLISLDSGHDDLRRHLDLLDRPPQRDALIARMRAAAVEQKEQIHAMWTQVDGLLRQIDVRGKHDTVIPF